MSAIIPQKITVGVSMLAETRDGEFDLARGMIGKVAYRNMCTAGMLICSARGRSHQAQHYPAEPGCAEEGVVEAEGVKSGCTAARNCSDLCSLAEEDAVEEVAAEEVVEDEMLSTEAGGDPSERYDA